MRDRSRALVEYFTAARAVDELQPSAGVALTGVLVPTQAANEAAQPARGHGSRLAAK